MSEAVESKGEPIVYLVPSNEHPGQPHRVDLSEANGLGSCSCRDWETNVARNRKAHPGQWHFYGTPNDKNPQRSMCRHINEAQQKLLMTILPEMAAAINKKQ